MKVNRTIAEAVFKIVVLKDKKTGRELWRAVKNSNYPGANVYVGTPRYIFTLNKDGSTRAIAKIQGDPIGENGAILSPLGVAAMFINKRAIAVDKL